MVGQRVAGFGREAEDAHRKPADGARHPVAIEVERRPVGGADVLSGVHRHAVDDGVEILLLEIEVRASPGRGRRDAAARGLRTSRRRRRASDRAPPGAAKQSRAHARRRCRRPRGRSHKGRTSPRAGSPAGYASPCRRSCAPRAPPLGSCGGLRPRPNGADQRRSKKTHDAQSADQRQSRPCRDCTRSLNGSRLSRSRARRRASAWMAAISTASRTSLISGISVLATIDQLACAAGDLGDGAAQGRGRARRAQHLDRSAMRGEDVQRQVDAIEARGSPRRNPEGG